MKKPLQRNRLKNIINHVIYGVQKAKKFKLGKRMVDIDYPSPRQCYNQIFFMKNADWQALHF